MTDLNIYTHITQTVFPVKVQAQTLNQNKLE